MIGVDVQKYSLDNMVHRAMIELRGSFDKLEGIYDWMIDNPVVNGVDPMAEKGYTEAECALFRMHIEELHQIRVDNAATFRRCRSFTGVE